MRKIMLLAAVLTLFGCGADAEVKLQHYHVPEVYESIPDGWGYDRRTKSIIPVRTILVEQRWTDINNTCNDPARGSSVVIGCASISRSTAANLIICRVRIPPVGSGISAEVQAEIRQHELTHCKGWRHDGEIPDPRDVEQALREHEHKISGRAADAASS